MASYLETLTVNDFKDYFNIRDFTYASIWINTTTYQVSDIVYYGITRTFYSCLQINTASIPTTTADWQALSDTFYVLDEDITKAFEQAISLSQEDIFSQETAKIVYFLITAHFISISLQGQGSNSEIDAPGFVTSKSVGDVSLGYGTNANLSYMQNFLATTGYGKQALLYIKSILASSTTFLVLGDTTDA